MRVGLSSFEFSKVYLDDAIVVSGPKEAKGPLGPLFDFVFTDLHAGEKTWEKAERTMLKRSINSLIKKKKLSEKDIDLIISGDLINQNVISNYVMRDFNIPFLGIYGACSTSVLGMINASILIDSENAERIITCASSHYGDAERQYRNPTEYGGAKPLTATSTVSGAVSILLNKKGKIKVRRATIGFVVDPNLNDPNDMGSAMAPAAAETIKRHLKDFNLDSDYYDLILTGDLSKVGAPILLDILKEYGINIEKNHNDAGLLIYDFDKQEVFSGGSGCGCMGMVSMSLIKAKLLEKTLKRVLLVGTGALLNPTILNQNETIPSIAHAISLEVIE